MSTCNNFEVWPVWLKYFLCSLGVFQAILKPSILEWERKWQFEIHMTFDMWYIINQVHFPVFFYCQSVVPINAFSCIKQNGKTSIFTFRAMTNPEGLWRTLLTTPPFPAPNSHIGSKSSSFSSPTWAFWVRKASRRLRCCSSRSNSPSFFCKASRLALGGRQELL